METVARLRSDHDEMMRLASALARGARLLDNGHGGDLALMRDLMCYLNEQPARVHHPLEDLALWRLADRAVLDRASAEGLDCEHRALRFRGARVLQLIDAAFADVHLPVSTIVAAAEQYLASLRSYLEREERVLLPLLEAHLAPVDWDRIAEDVDALAAPEWSTPIEEDLRRLSTSIAVRAEATR